MYFSLIYSIIFVGCVLSEEYTSKYDNIDLEAIIKNDRLLKNYADCLLDKGRCSADATELKKRIPEALATGCDKCSDKQKAGVGRVIKYLSENKKELWNNLLNKYDSEGAYRRKYQNLSKKENINV